MYNSNILGDEMKQKSKEKELNKLLCRQQELSELLSAEGKEESRDEVVSVISNKRVI